MLLPLSTLTSPQLGQQSKAHGSRGEEHKYYRLPRIKGVVCLKEEHGLPQHRTMNVDENEMFRLMPQQHPTSGPSPPKSPSSVSGRNRDLLPSLRNFRFKRSGDNFCEAPTRPSIAYPGNGGVFEVGDPFKLIPVVLGVADEFSIEPALPTYLAFDSKTGIVHGTPERVMQDATHVVTAWNAKGEVSATITLTVIPKLRALKYHGVTKRVKVGQPVAFDAEVKDEGLAQEFYVSPSLPTGLHLDPRTGAIRGVPSICVGLTVYAVVARNATSMVSCRLSFEIVPQSPTLAYPESEYIFQVGKEANLAPITSGVVDGFSVDVKLPAGLSISNDTGIISGIPETAVSGRAIIVTARNAGGVGTASVTLTVHPAIPTIQYPYAFPIELTCGEAMQLAPIVTSVVDSFSIQPQLPSGLSIDSTTGLISGVPNRTMREATSHYVNAGNVSGMASAQIDLIITPTLKYPGPKKSAQFGLPLRPKCVNRTYSFHVGSRIKLMPIVSGQFDGFSTHPSLPDGLDLDMKTGAIHGTVKTACKAAVYEVWGAVGVMAKCGARVIKAEVSLEVLPNPPRLKLPEGIYGIGRWRVEIGHSIRLSPVLTGLVDAVSVEPALPNGLRLDTRTGVISGKPMFVQREMTYTLTATNAGGRASLPINMCVLPIFKYTEELPVGTHMLTGSKRKKEAEIICQVGDDVMLKPSVKGDMEEFSVEPTLPAGISLDAETGVIMGIPSTMTLASSYMVIGKSVAGITRATVRIEVRPNLPSITYGSQASSCSPLVARVGDAVELRPTTGGVIDAFSVTPALPSGLALSQWTGVISGEVNAVSTKTTYTVTAHNMTGDASASVTIVVHAFLEYPSSKSTLVVGDYVEILPVVKGAVDQFIVEPSLPEGLDFDTSSGVISGKPTEATKADRYVVTGKSAGGTLVSGQLRLEVQPQQAKFNYPCPWPLRLLVGEAIELWPDTTGIIDRFSTTKLPEGLALDSVTGAITGIVASITPEATYVVRGQRAPGAVEAEICMEVKPPAPCLHYTFPHAVPIRLTVGCLTTLAPIASLADTYIAKGLPPGLSLNNATGEINGIPTSITPGAVCEVCAHNASGTTTTEVTFIVSPALTYPGGGKSCRVGEHVRMSPSMQPAGAFKAFSVEPALPEGLSLEGRTGVISGSPTTASSASTYAVTGNSVAGATVAEVTLQVENASVPPKTLKLGESQQVANGSVSSNNTFKLSQSRKNK